tara:strand:+ start:180 stop:335 length:156 start_codon:yes stop_codon:yes gene_type:complete
VVQTFIVKLPLVALAAMALMAAVEQHHNQSMLLHPTHLAVLHVQMSHLWHQ